MDSRELIDAQFDRAVEIVQSLPKNGPIQTGYEEKLAMYRCADLRFLRVATADNNDAYTTSLYKQGTYTATMTLAHRLR